MSDVIKSTRVLMITILTLGVILTLTGTAQAGWYVTQATAGQVQDETVLDALDLYYGWGMEVRIKPFKSTWVHFPILVPYGTKIRKIALEVYLENFNSRIDEIHVWSGASKLHEFKNLGWMGPAAHFEILDMGKDYMVTGVGISVKCDGLDGVGGFEIHYVGAGS